MELSPQPCCCSGCWGDKRSCHQGVLANGTARWAVVWSASWGCALAAGVRGSPGMPRLGMLHWVRILQRWSAFCCQRSVPRWPVSTEHPCVRGALGGARHWAARIVSRCHLLPVCWSRWQQGNGAEMLKIILGCYSQQLWCWEVMPWPLGRALAEPTALRSDTEGASDSRTHGGERGAGN